MPNTITLTEVKDLASLGANVVSAMQSLPASPKRILQFDNFVYARAEVNKNRDEVSRDNLNELAASLPLNWIDWGHQEKKRTGFYISAKVEGDAVVSGGIIWTDDDPQLPAKLASGELQQSMEADADRAQCSICGKEFASEKQYCEHIAPLENRFRFNATRKLYGMKATGGALTPRPAGTDTKADPNALRMIANVVMASDRTPPAPPEKPAEAHKMTAEELASKVQECKSILAAQRFFAASYANTPTQQYAGTDPSWGGTGWFHPVMSPQLYHPEPELIPATPASKPPLSAPAAVQEASAQAQQAATQRIEATASENRMGGISMTWFQKPEHTNTESVMVWREK